MKKIVEKILVGLLIAISVPAKGQYEFFCPKGSFAIEVSLSNPDQLRLPMYRNAITSLTVTGDHVIAGTTASEGLTPFIFSASISQQEMIDIFDLNKVVPGQKSIRSGFCKWKDHILIAGTVSLDNQGGHLLRIEIDADGKIKSKDLGTPVPGEGIFSLTNSTIEDKLFGITFPSGFFFSYDLESGNSLIFKDISPKEKEIEQLQQFALTPEWYLSRSLIIDHKGLVYGSMPVNKLFCFNPSNESFKILDCPLPDVWGRSVLGQVDSWAMSDDGQLSGGNSGDGQLFMLDTEKMKVKNLGKPAMMPRISGLTFGRDGNLYGITGASPGYTHLFSYNKEEGFHDYGNPEFTMKIPGIESGIPWRGFQLGTIAASEDGKYIVMGEDEALSQLLIFTVEAKK
jgi:hypothetical protein